MRRKKNILLRIAPSLFFLGLLPCLVSGEDSSLEKGQLSSLPPSSHAATIWNQAELFATPKVFSAESELLMEKEGIRPVFYEGATVNGETSRVFAWVGIPPGAENSGKVPGIVLVHGGGGTAFYDWVRLWMSRGYAAIAMDTTGSVPAEQHGMTIRGVNHSHAPKTIPNFSGAMSPPNSQWLYHAVASVVRANSLLRSLPGVDPERIGITGISWGGIITELTLGLDDRFAFAAPVYGSGFLGEDSFWLENDFQELPPETVDAWLRTWDPSQYLPQVQTPMLFCNGTNDKHFRPLPWSKTTALPRGPVWRCMKPGMGHAHPPTGDPQEITIFADSIVRKGPPLIQVIDHGHSSGKAWVKFTDPAKEVRLVFTSDNAEWVDRKWRQLSADLKTDTASASLPEGSTAFFFNIQDDRGCIVSSPLQISQEDP